MVLRADFYISFTEINQIGWILDFEDAAYAVSLAVEIFAKIGLYPTLQLSNAAAPRVAAHELTDLELFKRGDYF